MQCLQDEMKKQSGTVNGQNKQPGGQKCWIFRICFMCSETRNFSKCWRIKLITRVYTSMNNSFRLLDKEVKTSKSGEKCSKSKQ